MVVLISNMMYRVLEYTHLGVSIYCVLHTLIDGELLELVLSGKKMICKSKSFAPQKIKSDHELPTKVNFRDSNPLNIDCVDMHQACPWAVT